MATTTVQPVDPSRSLHEIALGSVILGERQQLLFHSDRGFEFAAKAFRDVLDQIEAVQSMSRKGNCWDNAVAESFFSTLEFEGPSMTSWRIVEDARPSLATFIESYYNARRLHSRNGYRSPNETEHHWRSEALAA